MGGKASQPVCPKRDLLPTHLQLGNQRLELQTDGTWIQVLGMADAHKEHLDHLEDTIQRLQSNLKAVYEEKGEVPPVQPSIVSFEREHEISRLAQRAMQLEEEVDQLKFRNRVLLAMYTLSNNDFEKVCDEAKLTDDQRDGIRNKMHDVAEQHNGKSKAKSSSTEDKGWETKVKARSEDARWDTGHRVQQVRRRDVASFEFLFAVKCRDLGEREGSMWVELFESDSSSWKMIDRSEIKRACPKPKFERKLKIRLIPNSAEESRMTQEYKLDVCTSPGEGSYGALQKAKKVLGCVLFSMQEIINSGNEAEFTVKSGHGRERGSLVIRMATSNRRGDHARF